MKNKPKRDTTREILFTTAAFEQVKALRLNAQDKAFFISRIKEVAELVRVTDDDDVCRIAQTDRKWYRLKLAELRPSLRVAFSLEDKGNTLLIRFAAARKEDTYDLIEALYILARQALR